MSATINWRDKIRVHPAADHPDNPMMPIPELVLMGEDIRKRGLREPIAFYFDKARPNVLKDARGAIDIATEAARLKDAGELPLIDGRNRLEAMQLVGLLDDDRLAKEIRRARIVWADEATPTEYVTTANFQRNHDPEAKRKVIARLLKAHPEKSDRQIAKDAGVKDNKLVGRVRAKQEDVGKVPHVETRTDSLGRQQPASKPASKPPAAPPPVTARPAPEPVKTVTAGVTPDRPLALDANSVSIDPTTSDDKLAEQLIELIGEERLLNMAPRFFERPLDPCSGEPGTNPIGKFVETFGKFTEDEDIPMAERRALAQSCLHVLDLTLEDLKPRRTRIEQWVECVEGLRDLQDQFQRSLDNDLSSDNKPQYRRYIDVDLSNLAVEHK